MMHSTQQPAAKPTAEQDSLVDRRATATVPKQPPRTEKPHQANTNSAKLHPKEHGAYAILGIPIVTALIMSDLTLLGVCVAVASVAGFLAHEPLLVAWGHRGRRAQRSTPAAKSRLAVLLLITLVAGCIALAAADSSQRWAIVTCLALAVSSFAVALVGQHRTIAGQLWGVIGLSFPCVPILMAGGANVPTSITVWAVWLLVFSATTLAVRSVIAAQKHQPRWPHALLLSMISLPVAAGAVFGADSLVLALPMISISWYLLIVPPAARHLKRVGWASVAGSLLTAALVISTFSSG
jgi:hypothetical protein